MSLPGSLFQHPLTPYYVLGQMSVPKQAAFETSQNCPTTRVGTVSYLLLCPFKAKLAWFLPMLNAFQSAASEFRNGSRKSPKGHETLLLLRNRSEGQCVASPRRKLFGSARFPRVRSQDHRPKLLDLLSPINLPLLCRDKAFPYSKPEVLQVWAPDQLQQQQHLCSF